jgi:hypothetical protein
MQTNASSKLRAIVRICFSAWEFSDESRLIRVNWQVASVSDMGFKRVEAGLLRRLAPQCLSLINAWLFEAAVALSLVLSVQRVLRELALIRDA